MGAYVVQAIAAQAEPPARSGYRAQKRDIRRCYIRRAAAAPQHPAVEAGVMGDKIVRTAHECGKIRPEIRKVGAVPEHAPGKTVDFRKADTGARRADERIQRIRDPAALNARHAEGAGAVRICVRSFKIQSHSRFRQGRDEDILRGRH